MVDEIERKWVIDKVPFDLSQYPSKEIDQGYLQASLFFLEPRVSDENDEVRIRRKGIEYFLTVKSGSGLERSEAEPPIPKTTFNGIWPLTSKSEGGSGRVEKTRYEIPYEGHTIELDVYHGDLEGRMTAEVEFDWVGGAMEFQAPEWFRDEVTSDKRYKNFSLAKNGWPKD